MMKPFEINRSTESGTFIDQLERLGEIGSDLDMMCGALRSIETVDRAVLTACIHNAHRSSVWLDEIVDQLREFYLSQMAGAA